MTWGKRLPFTLGSHLRSLSIHKERGCATLGRCAAIGMLLLFRSDQREHGSLWVAAENDPKVTGHLVRTHAYLAVLLLDACRRSINILDVEVVQPEGNRRLTTIAGHDRPHCSAAIVEHPVRAHRAHIHRAVLGPAEDAGVESPC